MKTWTWFVGSETRARMSAMENSRSGLRVEACPDRAYDLPHEWRMSRSHDDLMICDRCRIYANPEDVNGPRAHATQR